MKSDFWVPAETEVTEEVPTVEPLPITSDKLEEENQINQEEVSVQVNENIAAYHETSNSKDTHTAIANNNELKTEEKIPVELVTRQESENHYEKVVRMFPMFIQSIYIDFH